MGVDGEAQTSGDKLFKICLDASRADLRKLLQVERSNEAIRAVSAASIAQTATRCNGVEALVPSLPAEISSLYGKSRRSHAGVLNEESPGQAKNAVGESAKRLKANDDGPSSSEPSHSHSRTLNAFAIFPGVIDNSKPPTRQGRLSALWLSHQM